MILYFRPSITGREVVIVAESLFCHFICPWLSGREFVRVDSVSSTQLHDALSMFIQTPKFITTSMLS